MVKEKGGFNFPNLGKGSGIKGARREGLPGEGRLLKGGKGRVLLFLPQRRINWDLTSLKGKGRVLNLRKARVWLGVPKGGLIIKGNFPYGREAKGGGEKQLVNFKGSTYWPGTKGGII